MKMLLILTALLLLGRESAAATALVLTGALLLRFPWLRPWRVRRSRVSRRVTARLLGHRVGWLLSEPLSHHAIRRYRGIPPVASAAKSTEAIRLPYRRRRRLGFFEVCDLGSGRTWVGTVHGSPGGQMSLDPWGVAIVTPQELLALARSRFPGTEIVVVTPCWPTAVRAWWAGDPSLEVLGDWEGPTIVPVFDRNNRRILVYPFTPEGVKEVQCFLRRESRTW